MRRRFNVSEWKRLAWNAQNIPSYAQSKDQSWIHGFNVSSTILVTFEGIYLSESFAHGAPIFLPTLSAPQTPTLSSSSSSLAGKGEGRRRRRRNSFELYRFPLPPSSFLGFACLARLPAGKFHLDCVAARKGEKERECQIDYAYIHMCPSASDRLRSWLPSSGIC